ncbi:phosphotransferase enzyme family protein [Streptomyces monticola]|uniref:Phosphotransferase enzyme family protein n=1 Tax=Streptomyces monticola TaxID=2666263 RepID=A0ABW2JII2_9ACTN
MNTQAWVEEDFGITLTSLTEVHHGADELARLWEATAVDGSRYAVKLSAGGTSAGVGVAAWLSSRGVRGVPPPVRTRTGELFSVRDGRRLSMVPWIADTHAMSVGLSRPQWQAFGHLLSRVHATPPPPDLPRESYDPSELLAYVGEMDALARSTQPQDDDLTREAVALWLSSWDRLSFLAAQAAGLAGTLRTAEPSSPYVLCHADPHLGNVLLGVEGLWLIDWDDAVVAPRERDLMFVVGGGVLPWALATGEEQGWFAEGYGPAAPDPSRMAYYLSTRALEDVAYPVREVLGTGERGSREGALEIVRAVLSPTGLVGTALSWASGQG